MYDFSTFQCYNDNLKQKKESDGLPSKWETHFFMASLKKLPDHRDNRGKRHSLHFVLCCVTLAILSGRAELSSIQRYISNRIRWLRDVTGICDAGIVSRAQLPRILSSIDPKALNEITMSHFGIHLFETNGDDWYAGDGKALRGTPDEQGRQRARIVTFVHHDTRETVAQYEMNSTKKAEITVVRNLLRDTGLETQNITLDSLHLNPKTTAQIALAGGHYIIQAKHNQPTLCDILAHVAETMTPTTVINQTEKGHGRQEERWIWFFDLESVSFDERWLQSDFSTLAVVMRQTISTKDPSKISQELSYYLSNSSLSGDKEFISHNLRNAIRRHWGVEVVNWIRDVTFQEDKVKTKDTNLAQVLASIRTFAIRLLQHSKIPNFKAALEKFSDCPDFFYDFLLQAKVL